MLAAAGIDPDRPLSDHDLQTKFVDGDRMDEYLDYLVAKEPGQAGNWLADDFRVTDAEALNRIGALLAREGQRPGVEFSIAAVVRATGRRDVRAVGEDELERDIDRMLADERRLARRTRIVTRARR